MAEGNPHMWYEAARVHVKFMQHIKASFSPASRHASRFISAIQDSPEHLVKHVYQ